MQLVLRKGMKIMYKEVFESIKNMEMKEFSTFIGFDAVLDHLVKVVKQKNRKGEDILFSSIQEFGSYLGEKAGMSGCLELKTIQKRVGGNMAILALAMASYGVDTTCVGTLGKPEEMVYQELARKCKVYSIAPYGVCTALEFRDGKIMLAENESMQIGWNSIKEVLGEDILEGLIAQSDLLCLVNWSELINANEIWQNLLQFSIKHQISKHKKVFFDLSDFSHRNKSDILQCIKLIREYSDYFTTVLGLNENETRNLAKVLKLEFDQIKEVGKKMIEVLGIDTLVIHTNTDAFAFNKRGTLAEGRAFVTDTPVALTGAGDNFNAGFCIGQLMDLGLDACVLLGNASSGYYARYGKNTCITGLKAFIEAYLDGEVE